MSSKRSAAAIIVGNDDLLITILLFLPAKSLIRFKLVSREWQSLISDPYFCRCHTLNRRRRSETEPPLFILGKYSSEYIVYNPTIRRFFPFTFPLGVSNAVILQSCNGLVLLERFVGKGEERYHVFNPTTMQQRELPSLPIPTSSYVVDGLYLMFDPSLSLHYRVVCFAYLYAFPYADSPAKQGTLTLYVYDSETHKWKQLECERKRLYLRFRYGTYFNGGIYFARSDSGPHSYFCYRLSRLEFDPDNNYVMSDIPFPLPPVGRTTIGGMAMESNGYLLCYTLHRNDDADLIIDVWEWEMHENIWTNKCRINLNRSLGETGLVYTLPVLGIFRGPGDDEQDSFLLLGLFHKIVIYKFDGHVFELHDSTSSTPLFSDAHRFIDSIAPV